MGKQPDDILIERFLTEHPEDAARILDYLQNDDIVALLNALPDYLAVRLISHLNISLSVNCLQMIDSLKAAGIINQLPLEIVTTLVRNMPAGVRESILMNVSKETSSFLSKTLNYPEGAVGALMDPILYVLYEDIKVAEALKLLTNQTDENLYYIYILSRDHKLTGVLTLYKLFRSKSELLLKSVMTNRVTKILADITSKAILNHPGWQDYHVLPVVDKDNILQGSLRYQVVHRYQESSTKSRLPQNLINASGALAELYRLGLASLIRGASEIYSESGK